MHIKSNSDYNKQYEVVADTDFAAIYIKYYDNKLGQAPVLVLLREASMHDCTSCQPASVCSDIFRGCSCMYPAGSLCRPADHTVSSS